MIRKKKVVIMEGNLNEIGEIENGLKGILGKLRKERD